MKNFLSRYRWGIIIASIFFVVGIATLSHYGLNIDEPTHFIRGQAYLNLYLTGKNMYASEEFQKPRVSTWKIGQYSAKSYMETRDGGHPALNGILAAATNKIFFEQLGWLGDLESYHAFEIFVSSILVLLVFIIGKDAYGTLAGAVAALAVSLYPLFWGESHFNIKDPIETALYTAVIYFFYKGVANTKVRFLYLSAVFCGFALSVKFNIVFAPFIIIPYLVALGKPWFKKIPRRFVVAAIIYPCIVLGMFYVFWPYLWVSPVSRTLDTILYYKGIGTGGMNQPTYLRNGWNTYPAVFVFASTPPMVLLLVGLGLLAAIRRMSKEKDTVSLLVLLWLAVPILRVMMPGSSIYSGVRQILEFLPPLGIMAGLGASALVQWMDSFIKKRIVSRMIIIALFIPLVFVLIKLHPNENIYLNSLIGGISGAYGRKLPGTAETMGNAYRQGMEWLNRHAESGARLGLPVGLLSNIPTQYLRKDIRAGAYFSGLMQSGEYMMEMYSVDFPPPRYNYNILYLERFVAPVYAIRVDTVPILKIWKNDAEHIRPGYKERILVSDLKIEGGRTEGYLRIQPPGLMNAARLEIDYDPTGCEATGSGSMNYSLDGSVYATIAEDLYFFHRLYGHYKDYFQRKDSFTYFFPGTRFRSLELVPDNPASSCLLQYKRIRLYRLRAQESP